MSFDGSSGGSRSERESEHDKVRWKGRVSWLFRGSLVIVLATTLAAEERPIPVSKLELKSQWPSGVATRSLAFAAEDTIAVTQFPGADSVSRSITTFDWRGGKLQARASKSLPMYGGGGIFKEVYGVSNGNILEEVGPHSQLWSRDLDKLGEAFSRVLRPPAPQAGLVGEWLGANEWKLYRLGPPLSLVRSGRGEILSVSDDFAAVRVGRDVRIENAARGELVGKFQSEPGICAERVMILGRNRLMMACNNDRVLDFSGKVVSLLPKRDGWGALFGMSTDGSRVLFDDFTRRIPTFQRVSEFFESVISLGTSPNGESKGEQIRVVDTRTGAICFDLDSPDRLFGTAGDLHAALSPSGRYVAVVDGNELSVYALPDSCATR
jgi:hypothetical protein